LAASFGARAKLSTHQTSLLKRLRQTVEQIKAKRAELLPLTDTDNTNNPRVSLSLNGNDMSDWDVVEKTEILEVGSIGISTEIETKVEEAKVDLYEQIQGQEQTQSQSLDPSDLDNQFQMMEQVRTQDTQPPAPASAPTIIPLFKAEEDNLIQSLQNLKAILPRRKAAYGSTLVDLSTMTDLISKRSVPKAYGAANSALELEVRKEIAAAKGLLLNRLVYFCCLLPFLDYLLRLSYTDDIIWVIQEKLHEFIFITCHSSLAYTLIMLKLIRVC
jgi:hypothetical protein